MNGHAVIIGGGIGGLLAAHALAGRFERVTILERDRYPPDSSSAAPPARRGVPQSRCLHLLMAAGAAAFDELMPGWREEPVARGAVPFDASADAVIAFPRGLAAADRFGHHDVRLLPRPSRGRAAPWFRTEADSAGARGPEGPGAAQ